MASASPAMAGPFEAADFARLVPPDKKLSPEWVKSLFAKGSRTVYRGDELKKIGMPVGGLCAGQVYLGGDGNLWHWDIFNAQIGTGDAHYAHPLVAESPVLQGFAVSFRGKSNGGWVRSCPPTSFHWVPFLKSPSAANIPSAMSSTAIRANPSTFRWRSSRPSSP